MNPNQELLVGVFLILAGIVLAIFAYIVLTSKEPISLEEEEQEKLTDREDQAPPPLAEAIEAEPGPVEPEAPEKIPEKEIGAEPVPVPPVVQEVSPESEIKVPEMVEVIEPPSPVPAVEPSVERGEPPVERERIAIASLFRDEISGELIIQVGDRVYTDGESLKDSSDFTRVQYAAKDLNHWISTEPKARATVPREPEIAPPQAQSMIEQINEILQQKIVASDVEQKAVRLIEGPGGSVRVLVGVQSYDLGEVPDEQIQELIRESVAIWESRG